MQHANRRFLRPAVLSLLVSSLFATPSLAVDSFGPDAFRSMEFSGDCLQKNWAMTIENTLGLILSPEGRGTCTLELQFHSPVPLDSFTSVALQARGVGRSSAFTMEFEDGTKRSAAHPLRTELLKPGPRWEPLELRFDSLSEETEPKQVSLIRIIVRGRTKLSAAPSTLYLKELRFTGDVLAETPEEPLVISMDEPVAIASSADTHGSSEHLQHLMTSLSMTTNQWGEQAGHLLAGLNDFKMSFHLPQLPHLKPRVSYVLLALALWLLVPLYFRRRRPSNVTGPFGPLYEINTRIWKSRKDEHGISHLGGFNSITTTDLKGIKEAGFQSIWLMGIWDIGARVRDISKRYGADFAGSPFAINDYKVSEELGTEADFKALVDRAHSLQLKVILDFVPNHMGLDSDWLNRNPEFFIHRVLNESEAALSNTEIESRYPGHFVYRTPGYPQGGRRVQKAILVAYGKDPYFYPWIDTAQLDYAEPALRRKMIDVLSSMARIADGVRCDMAMLVLREQVKIHRHPEMSWEVFNRWMPEEFWAEAIRSVKRVNPRFTFIAETYWAMEGYLQNLGFDYTYNKPLYEAMCGAFHSGNAEGLLNFLRMLGTEFLAKGIHFLENHDEERAMNTLGAERQRSAAAMLCTLPGVALIHQGQMEGKRERLPVQRVVPIHQEPDDENLVSFYKKLLEKTQSSLFRLGRLHVLYSNNASFITYARVDGDERAVVIINASNHTQVGTVSLMPALRLKTSHPYLLTDLFYDLKSPDTKKQPTVLPSYTYSAAQLLNQGLYVELGPFDAHIFVLEPSGLNPLAHRVQKALRHFNEALPLPRLARRLIGPALLRSSDRHS